MIDLFLVLAAGGAVAAIFVVYGKPERKSP